MQDINDKLDTLAEQNAQIIGLLTDIKTSTTSNKRRMYHV